MIMAMTINHECAVMTAANGTKTPTFPPLQDLCHTTSHKGHNL